MKAISAVVQSLVLSGKIVVTVKLLDAYVDKIKFTSKDTGKETVITSIKFAVGLQTDKGRKMLVAVMKVGEREDAEQKLAALGLNEGTQIVLDVDQLTKAPPSGGKGEWVWSLKVNGAYPLLMESTDTTSATPPVQEAPIETQVSAGAFRAD